MSTIDFLQAKRLAADWLAEIEHASGCALEILEKETVTLGRGWVFFYNSAEYLRTGNMLDALAGNGPLFVAIDGRLTVLPSSEPWEHSIRQHLG